MTNGMGPNWTNTQRAKLKRNGSWTTVTEKITKNDGKSQTPMNTLYLIEWVNQVGNVFTDTLKLRGRRENSKVTLRAPCGPDRWIYGASFHDWIWFPPEKNTISSQWRWDSPTIYCRHLNSHIPTSYRSRCDCNWHVSCVADYSVTELITKEGKKMIGPHVYHFTEKLSGSPTHLLI